MSSQVGIWNSTNCYNQVCILASCSFLFCLLLGAVFSPTVLISYEEAESIFLGLQIILRPLVEETPADRSSLTN